MDRYTWMSPKLVENQSPVEGYGTYAAADISKDELLMVFGGYVMTTTEESELPVEAQDLAIQIERGLVIGRKTPAQKGTGDYVNHSCNPNAGIRGQISLYAMRDISTGEEITFDYGSVLFTPNGEMPYSLTCACGETVCRTVITSNDWRTEAVQRYGMKYLPFYIQDAIQNLNSVVSK